jgi:hypothetical protein
MKYLWLMVLLIPFQGNAHCRAPNESMCERQHKGRCYWGNMGCRSQKHLENKGSSILNNFKKSS